MKIAIALAGALLLSVAPAIAQEAAPATTPAATTEAAPAAAVDQSRLSPNMQSFMSKVDAMRQRRQAREGESTSRVLPEGDPVDSKGWHKAQGHKHVNWSGASGYSARRRHHHRRRHHAKADAAASTEATKSEPKAEAKTEEKAADKK